MAGLDGFAVQTDELARLASATDDLAERIRAAAGPGQPIDRASYGLVGQQFADLAATAADRSKDAIGDLATDTGRVADELRATRVGYLDVEHAAATAFDGLGR
jgi:excreted virulence factor EspC (type VII ESX diderm)